MRNKYSFVRGPWSTVDEVDFLRGLGSHVDPQFNTSGRTYSRRELLAKYIASMHLRQNWGDVNKAFVFSSANNMLYEEQHKAQVSKK